MGVYSVQRRAVSLRYFIINLCRILAGAKGIFSRFPRQRLSLPWIGLLIIFTPQSACGLSLSLKVNF